jgi:hypothetical protein
MDDKRKMIDNLYAIRIGLGTLYKIAEKIEKNVILIQDEKEIIKQINIDINNAHEVVEKDLEHKIKLMFPYSLDYNDKKLKKIQHLYVLIGWIVSFLGMPFLIIDLINENHYALLILLGSIFFGYIGYRVRGFSYEYISNKVDKHRKKIDELRLEQFHNKTETNEFLLSVDKYNKDKINIQLKSSIVIDLLHIDNWILSKELDQIYSEMKLSYSSMLNPIDWKFVDTIIYYVHTGRAESIKEALLLLENQILSDQLKLAINLGTKQIQESIKSFSGMINFRLTEIDKKLDFIQDDILTVYHAIESLSNNIKVLSSKNETLYNNLLQSQNKSSVDLVQAIEKSKEYTYKVEVMN